MGRPTIRCWNDFFFSPADPTALGLIRVAAGLLSFWSLFVLGLDLEDYFGSTGWAEAGAIRALSRPLSWSFWFMVPDGWLRPVWLGCLAILILFAMGLFSRITAVLSWAIVVATVHRLPVALFGFDQVLSALLLYLAVTGSSGQAVSLDRFLRRWRQARSRLSKRAAGRHKVGLRAAKAPDEPGVPPRHSVCESRATADPDSPGVDLCDGRHWRSFRARHGGTGLALWKTMATGEFVAIDFTPLAAWPVLVNLLTHASLLLELLYPVLVWVRMLRPLVLAGVVLLHLGIAVDESRAGRVRPGDACRESRFCVWGMAAWVMYRAGNQTSVTVLYDGACPRCRSSMALILSADPDQVIRPVDLTAVDVRTVHPSLSSEACMRSMHVVTSQGGVKKGLMRCGLLVGVCPCSGFLRCSGQSRVSRGRGDLSIMLWRPLGRATFPAPTRCAGSLLERRSTRLGIEAKLKTIPDLIAPWFHIEEMARP